MEKKRSVLATAAVATFLAAGVDVPPALGGGNQRRGKYDRARPATPFDRRPPVGRNAPCPCGSGSKFKKCCGKKRRPAPRITVTEQPKEDA